MVLLHLIADFLLQNDWMARNKFNLRNPAGWIHGLIHTLLMLFIFSPVVAVGIGLTHVLIDTRVPLNFWKKIYNKNTEAYVDIWCDQVLHFIILAIALKI